MFGLARPPATNERAPSGQNNVGSRLGSRFDCVTFMHKLVKPFTRRVALGFGLSTAISRLAPICRASAQTRTPEDLQLKFLRWSRTATGFADLSAGAARACMKMLLQCGITAESLFDLEPDFYRGTPLEKRLLEAWYTGVFSLTELSQIRNFETTLMWRAAGLEPPPSTCNTGPASWASAP
jgi:hypothetical protein